MKKTTCIGMITLTLWASRVALGEEWDESTVWDGLSGFFNPNWSEDFSASIGAKVWMNEWTRDSFLSQRVSAISDDGSLVITAEATNTQPDSQISEDIEPTPIPQLGIRYKWLFLTGSYYTETNFDFETTESRIRITVDVDDVIPLADVTTVNRRTGERFEWDVGGGIYVLPHVAIFGGYKKVVQDLDETFTSTNTLAPPTIEPQVVSINSNVEAKGPTIGIAASVPISKGFGIYGSYAHGFIDVKVDDVSDEIKRKRDGDYNVAELGFTYTHGTKHWAPHMPLSAATAYVGYRYQIIETDFNEPEQDRTDITKGFAAGVNLSF